MFNTDQDIIYVEVNDTVKWLPNY